MLIYPQLPQDAKKGWALLLEALLREPDFLVLRDCGRTTLLYLLCGAAFQTLATGSAQE